MTRRRVGVIAALGAVAAAGWLGRFDPSVADPLTRLPPGARLRRDLFNELRPVPLENCTFERFGEKHDGGYLMCGNLLGSVRAAYSYGISGYDGWGCDVSRRTGVTVHQYDCFNPTRPACDGGRTVFHDECVADRAFSDDERRPFDTIASQLERTGSGAVRVVMKMDVEGAEWESLLATPDAVLRRIDQLAIELHGVEKQQFVTLVRKLKEHFYVANLHFNNYGCRDDVAPFASWAYEVLFVNKAIAKVGKGRAPISQPLDAPNNPELPDCPRPRPIVVR
jgi:hypothetical protein